MNALLDPLRPYLWAVKLAGVTILLLFAFVGGCQVNAGRLADEQVAHRATKQRHDAVLADLADKTAAVAKLAKQASATAKAERETNNKRFDDAKRDADKAHHDLARALRDGTERLQPWWNCSARPTEGDAASVAGGQDAAADLREAGAADLIAAADHADRWIEWLQAEVISTRKACGVEP